MQFVLLFVHNVPTPEGRKAELARGRHFTHEVVTCQPKIRRRSGKVRQL